MITPVILSGGVGSRLWPLSRELYPKQLLALHGEDSLLQATVKRLKGLGDLCHPPIVVCNETHRFLVAEQLRLIGQHDATIILEPEGRNTAPAIAIAAFAAIDQYASKDADNVLLVLPADHLIQDNQAFQASIRQAYRCADTHLVTLGIVPEQAETAYGYIRRDTESPLKTDDGDFLAFPISEFKEKPDQATAQTYVDSGDYYWNSGLFMFTAETYLNELKHWANDIYLDCQQAFEDVTLDLESDFIRVDTTAFCRCRSDSIDYAIMEHSEKAVVVPLSSDWSDIGAWSALWSIAEKDHDDNVLLGDVISQNSHHNYLRAEHRLVATVGVNNLVVVETADAVLIADKDQVQDVKEIVNQLKQAQRPEVNLHTKVYRPWGSYQTVDEDPRFQVKRIQVKPGASLSLQMHYHRSEHWIVVKGTAKITRGEETLLLTENQSTYIPLGTQHRLENPGKIPLEIIEVQSGTYLGEDDIIRFEDNYGR